MPRRVRSCLLTFVTLAALLPPLIPAAQTMQPGEVAATASLTGINQFDTNIDGGGKFGWSGIFASGSASRQVTAELALGMNARYDYQNWNFNSPVAFGGRGPWNNLVSISLGLDFDYLAASGLSLGVSPTVGWSYESGAKTGVAVEWGAVFTVAQVFSKDLLVGIGASVFSHMEDTRSYRVSPFLIVKWQITDRLRLGNPFSAGITGGAGLELAYMLDDRWEVAGGAADRSDTFRLKNSGPNANGIGENSFYPVFARVSYRFAPKTQVDFYVVAIAGGKLTVMNPSGDDLAKADYKTAPAISLTLSHKF